MSSSSLQCASFLLFSVCTVTAAAVRYFIVFLFSVFFIDSFFCLCINGCLFSNYAFYFVIVSIVLLQFCVFDLELRAFFLINFARDLS